MASCLCPELHWNNLGGHTTIETSWQATCPSHFTYIVGWSSLMLSFPIATDWRGFSGCAEFQSPAWLVPLLITQCWGGSVHAWLCHCVMLTVSFPLRQVVMTDFFATFILKTHVCHPSSCQTSMEVSIRVFRGGFPFFS